MHRCIVAALLVSTVIRMAASDAESSQAAALRKRTAAQAFEQEPVAQQAAARPISSASRNVFHALNRVREGVVSPRILEAHGKALETRGICESMLTRWVAVHGPAQTVNQTLKTVSDLAVDSPHTPEARVARWQWFSVNFLKAQEPHANALVLHFLQLYAAWVAGKITDDQIAGRLPGSIARWQNDRHVYDAYGIDRVPDEMAPLVKQLDLSQIDIGHLPGEIILPRSIKRFANLTILDLADNSLSHIPPALTKLTNLRQLFLRENLFEDRDALDGIEELINLQVLDIEHNHLSVVPDCIEELRQLEELRLAYNRLERLPNFGILSLARLRRLTIGNEQGFPVDGSGFFSALRSLDHLEVVCLEAPRAQSTITLCPAQIRLFAGPVLGFNEKQECYLRPDIMEESEQPEEESEQEEDIT